MENGTMAGRKASKRGGRWTARVVDVFLPLALALGLAACAHKPPPDTEPVEAPLAYYWQSAEGHLRLLAAARPVKDWLADEGAPEQLKTRLLLAQRLRDFASQALALPENASYTRYADLNRPAALWNLVAAPPLSLQLRTWCHPVTGCIGYQGWFDEARAREAAARLAARGLDVAVYPVPAYSTLGWSNWLGGDPLLNTFVQGGEVELARLLFHELAHQLIYLKDDTAFNESFATAVERLGLARWLAGAGDERLRQTYAEAEQRREAFRMIKREARARLAVVYAQPGLSDADRLSRKAQVLAQLRHAYWQLRALWGVDPARVLPADRWVEEASNASLGAEGAYDQWVPAFEALFAREVGAGSDWRPFYDAVRRLAALPAPARQEALQALLRPGSR